MLLCPSPAQAHFRLMAPGGVCCCGLWARLPQVLTCPVPAQWCLLLWVSSSQDLVAADVGKSHYTSAPKHSGHTKSSVRRDVEHSWSSSRVVLLQSNLKQPHICGGRWCHDSTFPSTPKPYMMAPPRQVCYLMSKLVGSVRPPA